MGKKIKDGLYENKLEQAKDLAQQYEVSGTPTFIINEKFAIVGAQPIDSFKNALLSR